MKKLLFLSTLLLALAGRAQAQTAPAADIVVVRIVESKKATAIITRGEGKSEKIEFDIGFTDKGITSASEGYYKLFAEFYRTGYVLQSTITTAQNYVTLLFIKKQ